MRYIESVTFKQCISAQPSILRGFRAPLYGSRYYCQTSLKQHSGGHPEYKDNEIMRKEVAHISNPMSSLDALEVLAGNPRAAQCIHEIDLSSDSLDINRPSWEPENPALFQLFSTSSALDDAGLDPKSYYEEMGRQLTRNPERLPTYSQNAIAFLLSLLTNVKELKLPWCWETSDSSEKLIATLIRRAQQSTSVRSSACSGLVQLEVVHLPCLADHLLFLTLPELRTFAVTENMYQRQRRTKPLEIPSATELCFGHRMERLSLNKVRLDAKAIAFLLRHMPNLRTLNYVHGEVSVPSRRVTGDQARTDLDDPWDMYSFAEAVKHHSGHSIESLDLLLHSRDVPVCPGTGDLVDFRQLRELKLSLEFFVWQTNQEPRSIAEYLPESLATLRLYSRADKEHHVQTIQRIFHRFAEVQPQRLPRLQSVELVFGDDCRPDYRKEVDKIVEACSRMKCGVVEDYQLDYEDFGDDSWH